MKRRNFFGLLFALPVSLGVAKFDSEWKRTKPPVDEWVWVTFAGGHVGLAKLCDDGVWVQPENYVIISVTHWAKISKPQLPFDFQRRDWLNYEK